MKEALIDYKIARQQILKRVEPGDSERITLDNALGRILARDLLASHDLPRHDNSAMDGFAIRSEEGSVGSSLKIVGEVAAGATGDIAVDSGTAVRIMTGAVIPEGADAVIPIEKVEVEQGRIKLWFVTGTCRALAGCGL